MLSMGVGFPVLVALVYSYVCFYFKNLCYCHLPQIPNLNVFIIFYMSSLDPQTDSKLPEGLSGSHTDWLTLNVGGRYFTTTR